MRAPDPRWTLLGTLATPARGLVDGRGRVASAPGWALDWWIGAEDRWHRSDQEAAVRQHLVDDTPVIETAMHIPGGDAVHRAYVGRDRGADGGADLLVVEVENRSAVPVALALVVGPFDPHAPRGQGGSVSSLSLEVGVGVASCVLWVDDRPGLLLAKPPARAVGVPAGDDLLEVVAAGDAPRTFVPVSCPDGGARAALIHPLPHTAVVRVVLPLDTPAPWGSNRPGRRTTTGFPVALPSADQVAKGWEVQTRRDMAVTLPDPRWQAVTEANRAFLLLGAGDARTWVDSVDAIGALDRWGFHDEAAHLLRRAADPAFDGPPVDAATLVALADHLAFTGERALVEDLLSVVALGVRRADRPGRRTRRSGRASSADPKGAGSLWWRARGLAAAPVLLEAVGQVDGARAVQRRADRLAADLAAEGEAGAPGWPGAASPATTLRQARVELAELGPGRDERLGARLAWVLGAIGPTLCWPEEIDPERPADALGSGHDPVAGAAWLGLIRDLLVREVEGAAEPTLAVCSWLPPDWLGQSVEVHHAPTAHGQLSYAVRWHGARPALLWELETRPEATGPVRLRAPGLDPSWSSREARGEALLAGPDPAGPTRARPPIAEPVGESGQMPSAAPPDQGASFS